MAWRNILIIADIEGSSQCPDYEASSFKTPGWPQACLGMTLDIKAVTDALFYAGAETITVKDFHRTGYNIMKEYLDPKVRLVSGYVNGPVPGLGDPGNADALMMTGMHAPSGSEGFLAHTMTSRISLLLVNGEHVSEAQLFSASLASRGLSPVFYSACPVGCHQAADKIKGLHTFPIEKSAPGNAFQPEEWRSQLARAAVASLQNTSAAPYRMEGPFEVAVTMRDGERVAAKLARRWKLSHREATLQFSCRSFEDLYHTLIRICYLTPLVEKIAPAGLPLYNLYGHLGLNWARRQLKAN